MVRAEGLLSAAVVELGKEAEFARDKDLFELLQFLVLRPHKSLIASAGETKISISSRHFMGIVNLLFRSVC